MRHDQKPMMFKLIRDTKLFRRGQKVRAEWLTGALAAPVRGRYKGRGRWIRGWVHWADEDGRGFNSKPDAIPLF